MPKPIIDTAVGKHVGKNMFMFVHVLRLMLEEGASLLLAFYLIAPVFLGYTDGHGT